MNSIQIECFMAAAEQMNFTKAAEQLFITQSAFSRNISGLEEELELLLFQRHNNVLAITPGGQILYNWLRQSKKGYEKVLEAARNANAGNCQDLCLGFVRSELPTPEVAEALRHMTELYPEIHFQFEHFHAKDIVRRVEEHKIDVAVLIGTAVSGHSRLVSRFLGKIRRCIVVPNYHPLAKHEKISLWECAGETFISLKPEISPTFSESLRQICGESGFTPLILEARSTEEQQQMIVSGQGIGLVIENHVKRNNPLFKFLELEEALTVDQLCIWDRLNTNPHIQHFLDNFV